MKKILAVLVILAMMTTMLACGGAGKKEEPAAPANPAKQDAQTADTSQEADQKDASSDEQITLTFMRMGSPEQATPIFEPIIKQYEEEHPNIKIDFSVIGWAEALTKSKLLFSSGQFPDVGFMSQIGYEFAEQGLLLDLTPYFEKDKEFAENFTPSVLESVKYKDKIYWSPCAVGAFSLWYNADIFKQAGLDPEKPPKTLDELLDYAETIKQKTGIPGLAVGAKAESDLTHVFMSVYASNAGESLWNSSEQRLTFEDHKDAAIKSIAYMREMVERDIHQPNPIEIDFYGGRPLFRDHQVGMILDGVWALKEFRSQLEDGTETLRTASFPSGDAGCSSLMGIGGWAIPRSCEHPDEAWEFIKYLQNTENQSSHGDQWGLLPILKSQKELPQYQEYYWEPLINQTETSHGIIAHPETTFIETTIAQQISDAMMGKQTPEETFDNIVKTVNDKIN